MKYYIRVIGLFYVFNLEFHRHGLYVLNRIIPSNCIAKDHMNSPITPQYQCSCCEEVIHIVREAGVYCRKCCIRSGLIAPDNAAKIGNPHMIPRYTNIVPAVEIIVNPSPDPMSE